MNLEFEHPKDSGFIDRACCSSGVTNLQIQAQQTLIKSEAGDKTILKGQSGGRPSKNASDDNGTCSTKSDEAKNRCLLNEQSQNTTHKSVHGDDRTCSTETDKKKTPKRKRTEKVPKTGRAGAGGKYRYLANKSSFFLCVAESGKHVYQC